MRLRLRLAFASGAAFLSLVAPTPPPTQAIVGGHTSGRYHHYVVMVLAGRDRQPRCSGVWLRTDHGRRVVITDAHCLAGVGHEGAARVSFAARWSASAKVYSATFYVDPDYDSSTHLHDLAVLVLDRSPALPTARLADEETADSYRRGSSVTTVGYGDPDRGVRKAARETVTRHSRRWLYLRSGDGNSCMGDSGGPDLVRGHAIVLALTDQGSCERDQDYRVDTAEAHEFVDTAGR